jgi:hypothetical protein
LNFQKNSKIFVLFAIVEFFSTMSMHTLIILLFTAGVSCLISCALIWRKQLEAAQYLQLGKLKLSINTHGRLLLET